MIKLIFLYMLIDKMYNIQIVRSTCRFLEILSLLEFICSSKKSSPVLIITSSSFLR